MILLGDAAVVLKDFRNQIVDLTVTSPPYDDLRTYGGHTFDFKTIAEELFRVTKIGGIVVWVVGDRTVCGDESGTSFKQVLEFKEIGFKLHDTMIYRKKNTAFMRSNAYTDCFQYMFVLSKGIPYTFNPLKELAKEPTTRILRANKQADGSFTRVIGQQNRMKTKDNIWEYSVGLHNTTNDEIAFQHPAVMPERLAEDHIKSWSNERDLILDPFAGSGTTCKVAQQFNRKWVGIEINPEYVALAKKRLTPYIQQQRLEIFIG